MSIFYILAVRLHLGLFFASWNPHCATRLNININRLKKKLVHQTCQADTYTDLKCRCTVECLDYAFVQPAIPLHISVHKGCTVCVIFVTCAYFLWLLLLFHAGFPNTKLWQLLLWIYTTSMISMKINTSARVRMLF